MNCKEGDYKAGCWGIIRKMWYQNAPMVKQGKRNNSFSGALGLFLSIISKSVSSPIVIRQITERYKDVGAKDYNAIACFCPNETTIEREIDRITASEILSSYQRCSYSKDICDLMDICDSCIIHTEFCQPSNLGKDFDCLRDIFILKDGYFKQNSSKIHSRFKRQSKTCFYPANLKTADVFCNLSSRKVSCSQTCIKGYTLEVGSKLNLSCDRKKNVWKPHKFKECEPYVDCTISLVSGGVADCYTPTTKLPAMCYIECDAYEDKPELPRRAYICNDGKWSSGGLPFCAIHGSNIALIDSPQR